MRGLDLQAVISTDMLGVVDGGVDEGFEAPSNLDLVLDLDTVKAGWWSDGAFRLYFLGNVGGDPSRRAGDLQVSSSLETFDTFKLYEAWYAHRWFADRLEMLIGLHDLNADFYVSEHGGLFLNSSFGIGPEAAQTGPSIFSTTALGARLKFEITSYAYVMAAFYDGIPGDSDDPYGTHVRFDDGDGVYAIAEVGIRHDAELFYKVAVGGWHSSAAFEDVDGTARDANAGIYILGETDLVRNAKNGRGVGIFMQIGFAEEDRNQVGAYVGGGVNWTGPIAMRPTDVFGVAVAHARNSSDFLVLNPALGRAETTLELTYQMTPQPWLKLQPDVQYIISPGTDSALENALVVGLRLEITL
jgi:porin